MCLGISNVKIQHLLKGSNVLAITHAGVVKLVDTLDLGSSAARLGGSSPSTRTIQKKSDSWVGFFF